MVLCSKWEICLSWYYFLISKLELKSVVQRHTCILPFFFFFWLFMYFALKVPFQGFFFCKLQNVTGFETANTEKPSKKNKTSFLFPSPSCLLFLMWLSFGWRTGSRAIFSLLGFISCLILAGLELVRFSGLLEVHFQAGFIIRLDGLCTDGSKQVFYSWTDRASSFSCPY